MYASDYPERALTPLESRARPGETGKQPPPVGCTTTRQAQRLVRLSWVATSTTPRWDEMLIPNQGHDSCGQNQAELVEAVTYRLSFIFAAHNGNEVKRISFGFPPTSAFVLSNSVDKRATEC